MIEEPNISLPLAGLTQPAAWRLPAPVPTTFIMPWPARSPSAEAPDVTEITAALHAALESGLEVIGEIDPEAPEIAWAVAVDIPGLPVTAMLWCEPARSLDPEEVWDERIRQCSWVVGLQTLLGEDDPLDVHADLLRLLAAAFPNAPAILDANIGLWHPRESLNATFIETEVDPPVELLWRIHAVRDDRDPVVWLHTHGLWRCGLPELELLEVPTEHTDSAATLLTAAAALMFEQPLPEPGEPWLVGDHLPVTLQPWSRVTKTMRADRTGGANDRKADPEGEHRGVRAVLCDAEPRGRWRKVWHWPEQVIQRLERGEAALYHTTRATEREAMLARETWPDLVTLLGPISGGDDDASPLVFIKAGFRPDDAEDDAGREHLWFEAGGLEPGGAIGVLVNEPFRIGHLRRGAQMRLDRESITGWWVIVDGATYGPDRLADLRTALARRSCEQ